MADDSLSLAGFNRLDWQQIALQQAAWLRLAETIHLQVELGLLPEDAMSRLGYDDAFSNRALACVWPELRESLGSTFREYVERETEFDCTQITTAVN